MDLRGIRYAIAVGLIASTAASAVIASDLFETLKVDGQVVRWFQTGRAPVMLKYAIVMKEERQADAVNCRGLRAPSSLLARSQIDGGLFRTSLAEAFARWERHADISFVEVSDQTKADILIGEQTEPMGVAFTNLDLGSAEGGEMREIKRAKICLNPQQRWKIGFDGNLAIYDLVYALTHEIGHAIGLDHPGARGHLMSFRYDERLGDLSAGDISGAVFVYGPKPVETARKAFTPTLAKSGDLALP